MKDKIVYNEDPAHSERLFRIEEKKIDAGIMGRIFGSTQWAAASIAWVSIFMLIFSGILVLFYPGSVKPVEYWKIIAPLITLALGYLFGKSSE